MTDRLDLREGETLEFKERWNDRALEDLAAFANHCCGKLLVSVADNGSPVGFRPSDAELRSLTDQAADVLGLTPRVRRRRIHGHEVLELGVEPTLLPVSCRGRYFQRVGSTNREMTGEEVGRRFLERSGQSWDGLPSPWGLDRLEPESLFRFVRAARGRLPALAETDPPERILGNLGLLRDGRLTNGGVLLFTREPQRLFPLAQVRLARFPHPLVIEDDRTCAGNLFDQLDQAIGWLREHVGVRYEVRSESLTFEGIQRKEVWTWPADALREAILNALIHRDYTHLADIQIRLDPEGLGFWNAGDLFGGVTVEELSRPVHSSRQRNPAIAQTFYFTAAIERWGSGTTRMIELCREAGLPSPAFRLESGGLRVSFARASRPEVSELTGLNPRQRKAFEYVRTRGSITNREYRELTGIPSRTAVADLGDLVRRGLLSRRGVTGRSARYVPAGPETGGNAQETRRNAQETRHEGAGRSGGEE